jgi:hypothetical protein
MTDRPWPAWELKQEARAISATARAVRLLSAMAKAETSAIDTAIIRQAFIGPLPFAGHLDPHRS